MAPHPVSGGRDRGPAKLGFSVLLPFSGEAPVDDATPEKRLMLAVLAEAVFTFRRTAGAADVRRRRLFTETARWFASSSTDETFAFATICDTLGLDAEYIRGGLKRWRHRAREEACEVAAAPAPERAAG